MCPEEPPQLKQAKIDENVEKEQFTLEEFDSEPGFFEQIMKDMLLPGHENKLYTYLKEIGLLLQNVRCHGSLTDPDCMNEMTWERTRTVDKYTWKCKACNHKCSLREDSFFLLSKCSLMATIRIILGWCKDAEPYKIASILKKDKVKDYQIRKLFETCSEVIEVFVRRNQNLWQMGGENSIVLLDIYPEGCSKLPENQAQIINNNTTKILCLAETKVIPTQYWLHVLTSQDTESLTEEIIEVITTMIRPGSIIVTDPNSKICPQNIFYELKCYRNITIDQLIKHNRPNCSLFQILDTIWQPAINICNEAQNYRQYLVQAYLFEQMWRRKFARTPSQAMENFLYHIADQYPLSQE